MAEVNENPTVETVRPHSNSYGEKIEKEKGAQYDIADPIARQSMINSGLVKATKPAKAETTA